MDTVPSTCNVEIIIGDCLLSLGEIPDNSVHCCVTSPPYWGLRDYGVDGQLGLEKTPEEYITKMVEVFREVRRVLREDGTLWLNLGDSYANNGIKDPSSVGGFTGQRIKSGLKGAMDSRPRSIPANLKPKDLVGIPWRVALALQADGWYLRQDIIWHKPNPMPESVTDRCTKAHEYIFLLAKSERYYYDHEAVKEVATTPVGVTKSSNVDTSRMDKGYDGHRTRVGLTRGGIRHTGFRNRRSVWTVTTRPYKGAHFATFPPDLIRPCILAGCPKNGVVLDPFGGSGTTGQVALEEGRSAILLELNAEYKPLIQERVKKVRGKVTAA